MPAVGPYVVDVKLNITFTCRAFPAKVVEHYQTCNHDRGWISTFSFLTFTFCEDANTQTANIFGRDWKCRKIDESLHFPGLEPWLTALRGFLCDDVEVDVEADVGAPDEFRPFRVSMSRRAAILRCPKKTLSLAHSTPSLSLTCQYVGNSCYDS